MLALIIVPATMITVKAQEGTKGNIQLHAAWQYNQLLNNNFVDSKGSGRGMNIEINYKITDNLAVGLFTNWSNSQLYQPRQTIINDTKSITLDRVRTIYQNPFGIGVKYYLPINNVFIPYAGLKVGANYSIFRSENIAYNYMDNPLGLYASPEAGFLLTPFSYKKIGINGAVYYSYGSNKSKDFDISGLNNWGVRLGITVTL